MNEAVWFFLGSVYGLTIGKVTMLLPDPWRLIVLFGSAVVAGIIMAWRILRDAE